MVMTLKSDNTSERFALANNSASNTLLNTRNGGYGWYGGGRGRGNNHGRGRSGGNRGRGRGSGGRLNSNRDKLLCTHCGRYMHVQENCWDLNG